jgi:hypothetical protein
VSALVALSGVALAAGELVAVMPGLVELAGVALAAREQEAALVMVLVVVLVPAEAVLVRKRYS